MTYATVTTPGIETRTCANCPHFNNFRELNGRGWCKLFDHDCKAHQEMTGDCINSSDTITSHELEAHGSPKREAELRQSPSETMGRMPRFGLSAVACLQDNLEFFPNLDSDAFPTEEVDEADLPHTEYEVGSVVKVIDADEHHTQWGIFEIIERKHNEILYRNTESYLNEASWFLRHLLNGGNPRNAVSRYFRLASHDDATTINKDLWVREDEICHFEQSNLICTEEIF